MDYRETGARSNRNAYRDNGDSQHRGNGDSQHRGNGDSHHRSRRSKTPDGLKSQGFCIGADVRDDPEGFCIGADGRDDPAWLISETSEPRKSHISSKGSSPRRSELHSGDGKYQSRKRESHLNYKGQHSSVKDDKSSLADYQPYQEELSPDHSEYQPSIMDYQPRHRNHKLGQRECQTGLSDKTVRDSSRHVESPRKRHVEKS
ncbi:hypothetical protein EGW08_005089 [Elysia chlorotica]|uniref:Uncharacterized protein n=1 Tax=Elysia chlorotica TaxID=188477 RepID=A0A3S1BRS0_ELYCH|nr:hypothetical protein EGW08_005089 [Elysia chlorotica]